MTADDVLVASRKGALGGRMDDLTAIKPAIIHPGLNLLAHPSRPGPRLHLRLLVSNHERLSDMNIDHPRKTAGLWGV